MLTCSGYFLGCPQLCLIETKEAKKVEDDQATGFIGGISAESASIKSVFIETFSAEGSST